jgi:hypothetical protein
LIAIKARSGILLQGPPDLYQTAACAGAQARPVVWIDYWLAIPWMLYDAAALRVLTSAALALLVIAYAPSGVKSATGSA